MRSQSEFTDPLVLDEIELLTDLMIRATDVAPKHLSNAQIDEVLGIGQCSPAGGESRERGLPGSRPCG